MRNGAAAAIPFTAQVEQTVAEPLRFERSSMPALHAEDDPRCGHQPGWQARGFPCAWPAVDAALPTAAAAPDHEHRRLRIPAELQRATATSCSTPPGAMPSLGASSSAISPAAASAKLTSKPGFYYGPRYSRDGSKIVYSRTGGGGLTGSLWSGERGIYVDAGRGRRRACASRRVATRRSSRPMASAFYFFTGGGLSKKLMSVGLHGEEPREVFSLKYRTSSASARTASGWRSPSCSMPTSRRCRTPAAHRTEQGHHGDPGHARDARCRFLPALGGGFAFVHWMVGDEYYTRNLKDLFAFVPGAQRKLPKPRRQGRDARPERCPVDAPATWSRSACAHRHHARLKTRRR
jgi:hypothetical protein